MVFEGKKYIFKERFLMYRPLAKEWKINFNRTLIQKKVSKSLWKNYHANRKFLSLLLN
jgi:hypothetical protein